MCPIAHTLLRFLTMVPLMATSTTEVRGGYRRDGSILYVNETMAYNRIWNQASVHYRRMGEKGGREVAAFILADGRVLVLPDYKKIQVCSQKLGAMVTGLDLEKYLREKKCLEFPLRYILIKRERVMYRLLTEIDYSLKGWEPSLSLSWGMTDIHEDIFIIIVK